MGAKRDGRGMEENETEREKGRERARQGGKGCHNAPRGGLTPMLEHLISRWHSRRDGASLTDRTHEDE